MLFFDTNFCTLTSFTRIWMTISRTSFGPRIPIFHFSVYDERIDIELREITVHIAMLPIVLPVPSSLCPSHIITTNSETNSRASMGHTIYHGSMLRTIIHAWISNHIHYNAWDEMTHPFPNFNGTTVEVWEWISNFIPHFTGHEICYLCWDFS